ncbi:MAG: class A beta-lactamase [Caulobacterales bacterium]|nr:class A beta-lactamase [Caulobacterales bacterium]
MLDRRTLLAALAATPAAALAVGAGAPVLAAAARSAISRRMADIERMSGGRLGVAALDLQTQARFAYRADERYPMCSTFKASLAALVLKRADEGRERLDRVVAYGPEALVNYAPVTEKHVGAGLPIRTLCEAAVTQSDNTAANLLLEAVGGPPALTAFWRSLGDQVTRLDRHETEMSEAVPGDVRDTTSPAAMLDSLRKLTLGDALSASSRAQLTAWLVANQTGGKRLRAGLPEGWRVGDKTGSGGHGTTNDIAVIWPPGRAPLLISVYLTQATVGGGGRDAALASVARLLTTSGFGG